jgi:hypothetical protein
LNALSLVERRSRWAGRPRPPWLTLTCWYQPVVRHDAGASRAALEDLIRLADWAVHAPDQPGTHAPASEREIQHTCRSAVKLWTLSRFRRSISA